MTGTDDGRRGGLRRALSVLGFLAAALLVVLAIVPLAKWPFGTKPVSPDAVVGFASLRDPMALQSVGAVVSRDVEMPAALVRSLLKAAQDPTTRVPIRELVGYLPAPRNGPVTGPIGILFDPQVAIALDDQRNRDRLAVRLYDLGDSQADRLRQQLPDRFGDERSYFLTLRP
ncbi:MAG: hypothetical protein U1E23_01460 [Reyranellaceae bacterium]